MNRKRINPFYPSDGCNHAWDLINDCFVCVKCDKKVKKNRKDRYK